MARLPSPVRPAIVTYCSLNFLSAPRHSCRGHLPESSGLHCCLVVKVLAIKHFLSFLTQLWYCITFFSCCQVLFQFYFMSFCVVFPVVFTTIFILPVATKFVKHFFNFYFKLFFSIMLKLLCVNSISKWNGERGIWTLAPRERPTPLAGAPLQPLEYFSLAWV